MEIIMMAAIAVTYMINSRIGAVLLLLTAAHHLFTTKGSIYERLVKLIAYSAPYYVYSVWGDRQRLSLCIVSVAILCIMLTFSWLRRGARMGISSAYKFLLFLIFVVTYCVSVLWSYEPKETVFATYQLVVLAYLVIIIPICKSRELKAVDTDALLKLLVKGTCAIVIALYIQYGADVLLGVQLGEIYYYKAGRVIYNLYFSAKSVLSLYISVGMLYFFIDYINKKRITDLIWLALFGGAFLINNSRTGLASFALCVALYCIMNPKQIFGSVRVIAILTLVGVAGLYVIQYMMGTRAYLSGITDDNGRIGPILEAIRLLPQYIFSGIGGGAADYLMSSMGVSVHNFFVAYLIQFGVCGGLAVNALLLTPALGYKNKYWYLLCCVIIGGMLFAHWQNALFIMPVYMCVLLAREDGR